MRRAASVHRLKRSLPVRTGRLLPVKGWSGPLEPGHWPPTSSTWWSVPVLSCLVVLWVLSHSAADEALGLGILPLLAAVAYCTWRLVQRRVEKVRW